MESKPPVSSRKGRSRRSLVKRFLETKADPTPTAASTSAAHQHNAVLPIHSIPAEIFLDILLLSIEFEVFEQPLVPQLHALAKVCAHWLYSILSEPRFWRIISFWEKRWREKVLMKNPNGLLAVRVGGWEAGETNLFLGAACEHVARWKRLTVHANLDGESVQLLDTSAPRLKYLFIRHVVHGGEVLVIPLTAPAVEDLELDNVRFPWDSPTLSGLKHLSISHIRCQLPTFMQLVTILQASPQLQSFGLKSLSPSPGEKVEKLVPPEFRGHILLPALEGLVLASPDYPITRYLPGWIEVPNCHLLRIDVAFSELVRPGSTAPWLYSIPPQGQYVDIAVRIGTDGKTIITFSSPGTDGCAYEWKSNPAHSGGLISISDVPYGVENWGMLLEALAPVVEWGIYPLSLTIGLGMGDFSADDIGFWDSATSISFLLAYPHLLSALQYLSEPTTGPDGALQWPCSELTSVSFFTHRLRGDWSSDITPEELAAGVLDFLRKRTFASDQGELGDEGGEGLAPMAIRVIYGHSRLIELLRGEVLEGVQLLGSDW